LILSAGFLYGLGAAIAFALADPGAAFLSRRMGALAATLLVAIAGLPLVALGTLVYNEPLATSVSSTVVGLLLGVGAAISYVGLYYAFAVGPLSVVGPITALFGTVTVLFAVLFLGERLTIAGSALCTGSGRARFGDHGHDAAPDQGRRLGADGDSGTNRRGNHRLRRSFCGCEVLAGDGGP